MPQRGRPPQPGTAEEKAALRREKVRLYVKAHRERKKHAAVVPSPASKSGQESFSSVSPPSTASIGRGSQPEHSPVRKTSSDETTPESQELEPSEVKPPSSQWLVQRQTGGYTNSTSSLNIAPRGGHDVAFALIGTFRGQFLPTAVCVPGRQEFGSELVTPCSAWITNAYNIALKQDNGALKSSILAVGLSLTAMQNGDERLRMASLDVYRKALRQVRTDLKPLTTGQATNYLVPYLSCLAAAMFEMVHDGFSENIMQHVRGATSLMELLPRDTNVNHLLSDLLLEDLAMWEIVFALKYRYPSPLRRLRQQKGARDYMVMGDLNGTSRNATVLGDLLDGADEIPAVMSKIDELRATVDSESKHSALQVELVKLSRILQDLRRWCISFHKRFGPIYIQIATPAESGQSSPPTLQFVSYEVAAAWVYCLTFTLCALETNIEVLNELIRFYQSQASHFTTMTEAGVPNVVPKITSHIQLKPDYSTYPSVTEDLQPIPHASSVEYGHLYEQLNCLRIKLRSDTTQLIEALCVFIPIPKGIIGASLVLFPLDRCKAMLKRELARLAADLANMKANGVDDDAEIVQNIHQMSHSMTVYETMEQTLKTMGMPPMPEDD